VDILKAAIENKSEMNYVRENVIDGEFTETGFNWNVKSSMNIGLS